MEIQQAIGALEGLFWLALAVIIIYWPCQKVLIDYARDVVFEQRDLVFDLAAAGRLQFGSKQYETVRSSMNAMIRLAHCLTVPRLAMTALSVKLSEGGTSPSASHNIYSVIAEIEDADTREAVKAAMRRAERALVFMMEMRSPLTLLLVSLIRFLRCPSLRYSSSLFSRTIERAIGNEIRNAA